MHDGYCIWPAASAQAYAPGDQPTQLVDDVAAPQPLDVRKGMIRLDVTVQDKSG